MGAQGDPGAHFLVDLGEILESCLLVVGIFPMILCTKFGRQRQIEKREKKKRREGEGRGIKGKRGQEGAGRQRKAKEETRKEGQEKGRE